LGHELFNLEFSLQLATIRGKILNFITMEKTKAAKNIYFFGITYVMNYPFPFNQIYILKI